VFKILSDDKKFDTAATNETRAQFEKILADAETYLDAQRAQAPGCA
jgi:hypothetical protein